MPPEPVPHPSAHLKPGRKITGMSAVLLPFDAAGAVDYAALAANVERTVTAGLTPAVNMDTGYVQLLDDAARTRVLETARDAAHSGFVAGAYVADTAGDAFDADAYRAAIEAIEAHGGTPVVFPSHGLNALPGDGWVEAHAQLAASCDRFIAFELGDMFVPYGVIQTIDTYAGLMSLSQCIGAKHSSLSRELEWQRLAVRDAQRPDFMVLTGNDLAIDMVMWGSDYLLGLSAFAPEHFALRDRMWAEGDAGFYALNDLLQYLGFFAFRAPVPAYKHDAAMFLSLRGRIASDATHPDSPARPASDREVLAEIAERLEGAWP